LQFSVAEVIGGGGGGGGGGGHSKTADLFGLLGLWLLVSIVEKPFRELAVQALPKNVLSTKYILA